MFDIAWSEIGVVLIVALLVVGPKDIPVVIRTLKRYKVKMQALRQEVAKVIDEVAGEEEIVSLHQDLKQEVNQLNQHIRMITDLEGKRQPAYDISDLRPDLGRAKPAATQTTLREDAEKSTLH